MRCAAGTGEVHGEALSTDCFEPSWKRVGAAIEDIGRRLTDQWDEAVLKVGDL